MDGGVLAESPHSVIKKCIIMMIAIVMMIMSCKQSMHNFPVEYQERDEMQFNANYCNAQFIYPATLVHLRQPSRQEGKEKKKR